MMRAIIAAGLLAALAAPAFADNTTTIKRSTSCYSGNCSTETKITRPDPPPQPHCGYNPNFGSDPRCGGGGGGSTASPSPQSDAITYMPRSSGPAAPVDPKCMKHNACLKIYP